MLTHFNTYDLTAEVVKDKERCRIVSDAVFDRAIWDRLDDGTISDENAKHKFLAALPEDMHAEAVAAYDGWIKNLRPIDGMHEVVKELKARGAELYLLSNISIGFAESYSQVPWINELFLMFDGLVFSGPIHVTKPGAEIFRHLVTKYNLSPKECLFIDDSKINTDGAEAFGIPAYLFDGDVGKLRRTLGL